MHPQPMKLLCCIAGILFLVSLVVSRADAIDTNGRYFAYALGQKSCGEYIRLRERNLTTLERQYERYTKDELYEIVDKVIEHWIAGFLTASDFYLADTYNIAGNTTMDELKGRLETICRANDKQYVGAAMVTLIQELNPQRVKTDPEN